MPPIYLGFLLHCHYQTGEHPAVRGAMRNELISFFVARRLIEPYYVDRLTVHRGSHRNDERLYCTTKEGGQLVARLCQFLAEEAGPCE